MEVQSTTALRFYSHNRGELRCLSNFYPSPFMADGVEWATVEHRFQALKFPPGSARAQAIWSARTPAEAKQLGQQPGLRPDWDLVRDDVMLDALRAKFAQNRDLLAVLLGTGDAELIEAAPNDFYWGEGADGSGQNMLGRLLMLVRDEFR